MTSPPCPCGAGQRYDDCCGPFHQGTANAATALALMRSRFSAFALGDVAYLQRTWHPRTRPASMQPDPGRRWTRLEVLATSAGGPFDADGIVQFAAYYELEGRGGVQVERSSFVRENRTWYYLAALPSAD